MPKKKLKTGPAPQGLGPPFSIRLTLEQEAKLRSMRRETGKGKGEIIREWIKKGMP